MVKSPVQIQLEIYCTRDRGSASLCRHNGAECRSQRCDAMRCGMIWLVHLHRLSLVHRSLASSSSSASPHRGPKNKMTFASIVNCQERQSRLPEDGPRLEKASA